MVVLVIVGLMTTAVVLTLPDGSDALRQEADRFGMRLQRAQEEAILSTRAVQVTADAQGYGFSSQRFGGWQPLHDGPFGTVRWEDDIQPVFVSGREQTTFQFDPAGGATVETLMLARGSERLRIAVDAAAKVRIDASPN